jgi:hypothetical protein
LYHELVPLIDPIWFIFWRCCGIAWEDSQSSKNEIPNNKIRSTPRTNRYLYSLTRARRSKVRIRRTRVQHDKPISIAQKIFEWSALDVSIVTNLRLLGRILDREWGYFQKLVSLHIDPYTDGITLSCILQLTQDIQPKYYTPIIYERTRAKGVFRGNEIE